MNLNNQKILKLISEGYTIQFISNYRKEQVIIDTDKWYDSNDVLKEIRKFLDNEELNYNNAITSEKIRMKDLELMRSL